MVSEGVNGFLSNSDYYVRTFADGILSSAAGSAVSGAVRAVITGQDIGNALADGFIHGAMSGAITTLVAASLNQTCFTKGTLIATLEGSKPIEQIKEGDLVLSRDDKTGEVAYKPVVETFVRKTGKIVRLVVNGEVIETTPEHPFWVGEEVLMASTEKLHVGKNGQWIEAGYLKERMLVMTADGTYKPLEAAEVLPVTQTVYNFEVQDWHSYHVGESGVWVHNYGDEEAKDNKDLKDIVAPCGSAAARAWYGNRYESVCGPDDGIRYGVGPIGGGGGRRVIRPNAARSAATRVIDTKRVIRSAATPYKNTTVLGHALSKHAGRNPHIWGKLTGNDATWHGKAMRHFNDIMRAPGQFQPTPNHNGTIFLEKRLPDGRGMRLNRDGTFKGFID